MESIPHHSFLAHPKSHRSKLFGLEKISCGDLCYPLYLYHPQSQKKISNRKVSSSSAQHFSRSLDPSLNNPCVHSDPALLALEVADAYKTGALLQNVELKRQEQRPGVTTPVARDERR